MKHTIIIGAPAKINVGLWVKHKRQDGFHEISSLMQSISLDDTLTLKEVSEPGIKIYCDNPNVPTDETNLVYKAAKLFVDQYEIDPALAIYIEKKIPIAAGLAGGSTDAAATLIGLSRLYDRSVMFSDIMELASQIGSDVPFLLHGGLAIATGRGERLSFYDSPRKAYTVVVVVPSNIGISTKWAYDNYVPGDNETKARAFDKILTAYQSGDIRALKNLVFNDLESVTLPATPEVGRIKQILNSTGEGLVLMSGSGPAVFGLFDDKKSALNAVKGLDGLPVEVFIERTTRKNL